MLSTFPYFTIAESRDIHRKLYTGKSVHSLRFPNAFFGISQKEANEYLLTRSPSSDRVALFGLPDDIPYTVEMLSHERVSALKMYYAYVEPSAQTIYECFPPRILERAEALGIPIILHLPKVITTSQDDLAKVLEDFPRLKVVLAHLGLTKFFIPGLRDAYERFAKNENVYLDTALNPSGEVVALALQVFGWRKIMFGSDEPLNLLRSKPYHNPILGERLLTDYPYHWVDSDEQCQFVHLAGDLVHAQWLQLGALHYAIEALPIEERELAKGAIFFGNAKQVYGF
jgi:hypothetical protein